MPVRREADSNTRLVTMCTILIHAQWLSQSTFSDQLVDLTSQLISTTSLDDSLQLKSDIASLCVHGGYQISQRKQRFVIHDIIHYPLCMGHVHPISLLSCRGINTRVLHHFTHTNFLRIMT